jgi:hypothetical protein
LKESGIFSPLLERRRSVTEAGFALTMPFLIRKVEKDARQPTATHLKPQSAHAAHARPMRAQVQAFPNHVISPPRQP